MLEALRMAADDATIEGWLVPFDGPFSGKDSYGTRFTASTDYALDWFTERPLLFQHGLDPATGLTPVGRIRSVEVKDKGVWMQAQLDAQSEYFESIREMVKAGKLFLSSGSVEHLVQIDRRSGDVLRWPLIEGSMTPTPSNLLATIPVHTLRAAVRAAGMEDVDGAMDSHFGDSGGTITHAPLRADGMMDDPEDVADGGVGEATEDAAVPMVSRTEGSYEDLREDLTRLLNPASPFMVPGVWVHIIATFPGYCIACRHEEGGDETYWRIAYAIGPDGEPVLGAAEQVEEAYIPVVRALVGPLSTDLAYLARNAAALTVETKACGERRYREGRVLSSVNRKGIADTISGLRAIADELDALLQRAEREDVAAAEAARYADPEAVRLRIRLLELSAI